MKTIIKHQKPKKKDKEFLSKLEACEYLGCSFRVLKRALDRGEIPFRCAGRKYFILRENLRRWAIGETVVGSDNN